MKLTSHCFRDGAALPEEHAFAVVDPGTRIRSGANRNPHLAWSDVPAGTRSFALICHDPDVPSRLDDVNRDDRQVPASLPRTSFYHWILLDIPADVREIGMGRHSDGVTPGGKAGSAAPGAPREGINDYTSWFADDPVMAGEYHGYDGPAPPWNDQLRHRYIFTLYALDVPRLRVDGPLTGPNVVAALPGHVLEQASLTGTYSLNPSLQAH